MVQNLSVKIFVVGVLILAGLSAIDQEEVWPLLAASALLTLALRFRPTTRVIGRSVEILAIALAAIFVLDKLGVTIIFVYKTVIAGLIFFVVLMERDHFFSTDVRTEGFYRHLRLCSLAALGAVAVVAVGHFVYRGESFGIVRAPMEVMILVGIGWAVLNTSAEEFIYRGILFSRLKENMHPTLALVVQAGVFGLAHFWTKVPLGWPGALMAFLFGLLLGWLVRKTESLLSAIYVHFWVDLALYFSVLMRQ